MTGLTLEVDGRRWKGWKEVRVTRGLDRAASDFEIAVTEKWPGQAEPWPLGPGQPCNVLLDEEPVITGHIDSYEPSFDSAAHGVRIAGRSKTADLVDCAALVKGGQYRNYGIDAIARALCQPFGIEVVMEAAAGKRFADVQIQPGETCFELIERLCRLRALLASDDARGRLVLTRARAGSRPRTEPLEQGVNILAASAALSHAARFSDYHVRGQQAGTDNLFGAAASQPAAHVKDAAVKRYRPRLVLAEAQGGGASFKERAEWERAAAAGKGTAVAVSLAGWRQSTGALWEPGHVAPVRAPWLGLDRDLVILTVEQRLGNEGAYTSLRLVPEEALLPEPPDGDPATAGDGTAGRGGLYNVVPLPGGSS